MMLHSINPAVQGVGAMIPLIGGGEADTKNITFNEAIHHFYMNGKDVTDRIFRRDKEAYWNRFDSAKDNERLYVEKYMRNHEGKLPPEVGPTSTWANFRHLLITDPLGAPLEMADELVENTMKSLVGSTTVWVVGIGVAAYLLYQSKLK